ncbi:hypothetical protein C0V73_07445 [Rhizobium sp. TH135]|uniref:hypothetical protein n=1 Tax=Rhizobium sp. TH135 TaxID=2067451 RepID=UPI000C7BFE6D|nr:hypothetical protein [Rhizobium sp. TH135]PLK71924.1 hypothetical protein C0V73_07445 [Rhizobium sp. TH135]
MANKSLVVAFAFLCPFVTPAEAIERIYCAASDTVIDMSLESGFSNKDQEKLVHFRGMAGVKDKAAPSGFRRFQITSEMLRQYWIDDRDLRFSIHAFAPQREPLYRVTMSMITDRSSDTEMRFKGRYAMKVEKLKMGGTAGAETIITHEGSIFCDVKR